MPGQYTSTITSWIDFGLSLKMQTPWPNDKKKEFVPSSRRILHTWHTDARCGHWQSPLQRDWKVFLCRKSLSEQFVFGQYTSPMRILVPLSYPQSGVNALQIVIALKNVTLVSNKKSILKEMLDFTVTQVDNFCKNEVITVMFKLFDGKDASLVCFKPER